MSGPTARATLPGSVHGVVVHARINVPPGNLSLPGDFVILNLRVTDVSVTVLYP